ncbi:hypothetical protein DVH24_024062 [Malus domestica]|uniref:Uncharacterized protein n=1 Tax=Malus domestica TaxID=3750 RepID=A0A498JFC3_MALDO|nr:hypothetical protein DVH24_024062 [Malus domestica]
MNNTGCSLFLFDSDIPEVNAYKSVFANCNEPMKILAPPPDNIPCTKLLQAVLQNDTFFCKACVKCLDTYKVNLVLEYHTIEINALIIGKSGEKLFGVPCKDLVLNQRLVYQQQLPNETKTSSGALKNIQYGSSAYVKNSSGCFMACK